MCTSQFEGAEYKSNIGILQFFIQKLSLGKLVPKLKSYCIYLNICTQANLKVAKPITNQISKNNKMQAFVRNGAIYHLPSIKYNAYTPLFNSHCILFPLCFSYEATCKSSHIDQQER